MYTTLTKAFAHDKGLQGESIWDEGIKIERLLTTVIKGLYVAYVQAAFVLKHLGQMLLRYGKIVKVKCLLDEGI